MGRFGGSTGDDVTLGPSVQGGIGAGVAQLLKWPRRKHRLLVSPGKRPWRQEGSLVRGRFQKHQESTRAAEQTGRQTLRCLCKQANKCSSRSSSSFSEIPRCSQNQTQVEIFFSLFNLARKTFRFSRSHCHSLYVRLYICAPLK